MRNSEYRLQRLISKAVRQDEITVPENPYDFSRLSNDELLELINGIEDGTISEERINELLA